MSYWPIPRRCVATRTSPRRSSTNVRVPWDKVHRIGTNDTVVTSSRGCSEVVQAARHDSVQLASRV
eukprot:6620308-Prorocentrum_lima.AAC.1